MLQRGKFLSIFGFFLGLWLAGFAATGSAEAQNISFNDPLVDAADRGNESVLISLLRDGHSANARGKFDVTALMRAAYRGHTKIAELLLTAGADPNNVDIGGASALHLASRQGNKHTVSLLLKYEAYMNLTDSEGWTPLMRAINAGNHDIIDTLVKAGADINLANSSKETALIKAARAKDEKTVRLLLESGAEVAAANNMGDTAIDIARSKNAANIQQILLAHNQDKSAPPAQQKIVSTQPEPSGFFIEVKDTEEKIEIPPPPVLNVIPQGSALPTPKVEIAPSPQKLGKLEPSLGGATTIITGTPWIEEEPGRIPMLSSRRKPADTAELPPELPIKFIEPEEKKQVAMLSSSAPQPQPEISDEAEELEKAQARARALVEERKKQIAEKKAAEKKVEEKLAEARALVKAAEEKEQVRLKKEREEAEKQAAKQEAKRIAEAEKKVEQKLAANDKDDSKTNGSNWFEAQQEKRQLKRKVATSKIEEKPAGIFHEYESLSDEKTEYSSLSPAEIKLRKELEKIEEKRIEEKKQKLQLAEKPAPEEKKQKAEKAPGIKVKNIAAAPLKKQPAKTAEFEIVVLDGMPWLEKNPPAENPLKVAENTEKKEIAKIIPTAQKMPKLPEFPKLSASKPLFQPIPSSRPFAELSKNETPWHTAPSPAPVLKPFSTVDGTPWFKPKANDKPEKQLAMANNIGSDGRTDNGTGEGENEMLKPPINLVQFDDKLMTEKETMLQNRLDELEEKISKARSRRDILAEKQAGDTTSPSPVANPDAAPKPSFKPLELVKPKPEPDKDEEESRSASTPVRQEAAEVKVSEAVRVPLTTPNKVVVQSGADINDYRPGIFSPSKNNGNRGYWLQIAPFKSAGDAIDHFDNVISKEGLALRMKIVTPADNNAIRTLRVGTFASSADAAEACISFNTENLDCSVIYELNSSAPANNKIRTRKFGYSRSDENRRNSQIQPNFSGDSLYWIQLGTFASEYMAISRWEQLKEVHADILGGLSPNIKKPRYSSSAGNSFRLRAGPFRAKSQANEYCRIMKKRYLPCISVAGR